MLIQVLKEEAQMRVRFLCLRLQFTIMETNKTIFKPADAVLFIRVHTEKIL